MDSPTSPTQKPCRPTPCTHLRDGADKVLVCSFQKSHKERITLHKTLSNQQHNSCSTCLCKLCEKSRYVIFENIILLKDLALVRKFNAEFRVPLNTAEAQSHALVKVCDAGTVRDVIVFRHDCCCYLFVIGFINRQWHEPEAAKRNASNLAKIKIS